MADQHDDHRQPPPPPPLRSQPPPRPPPPRPLSRSVTQGILDRPSTSAAGLNRSTEAIPAYTDVVMRSRPNRRNTGGSGNPINRNIGDRSKFRRTQSLRVPGKKRGRRPQITIVSSQPMNEDPAFADGIKGGYIPPEAPPSYDDVLKQQRRESFTFDEQQPKITSDDAFVDRLTYRDIEIYPSTRGRSSEPSTTTSYTTASETEQSPQQTSSYTTASETEQSPQQTSSYTTASETESQLSSHEMSVELQLVSSDVASTTTNGAVTTTQHEESTVTTTQHEESTVTTTRHDNLSTDVVGTCKTPSTSTSDNNDDQTKIPIKPPRRKSSAATPRRPTIPPLKPAVAPTNPPLKPAVAPTNPPLKPVLATKPVIVSSNEATSVLPTKPLLAVKPVVAPPTVSSETPPKPAVVAPRPPPTVSNVETPPRPLSTVSNIEKPPRPLSTVSNIETPPRPLSTVSNIDIDEASGYATLNFSQGEPVEQQNGRKYIEEEIVETTTDGKQQQQTREEDDKVEQKQKIIANEAIYAKLNKKPTRKPPPRPQVKPRDPPPLPPAIDDDDDEIPPPLPTTRPPPEQSGKPVPKPRSRISSVKPVDAVGGSVKPAVDVGSDSAATRVSFVEETTTAFQHRSNSNVAPHPSSPPSSSDPRRSSQPFTQSTDTQSPSVEHSSKDKKSKMGVLRSKSLRWTKGKFKNLKKDSSKNSSESPKPTTPDEKRRSISSTTPKKPSSPAHRVPPGRPSLPAVLPITPSERRAPPSRPKPPVRPPPPKISSIDHVKIKSPPAAVKMDMEKHRENVVDEKMKSYMSQQQGYFIAICNHTDFSDLTFCTGDRILVMYSITDELVFGRNEDGEEGPFPINCVRREHDDNMMMMMSVNENNNVNRQQQSTPLYQPSTSRWSSSSDGLSLQLPQEKPSPSHQRGRIPPARPTRPPVPNTPEKTLIQPPLNNQHIIGDDVDGGDETNNNKRSTDDDDGRLQVNYTTTTEEEDISVADDDDIQPTTSTNIKSNISSAIICENTTTKTPATTTKTPVKTPDDTKTPIQTPNTSAEAPSVAAPAPSVAAPAPSVAAPSVAPSPTCFNVIALYTYNTGVEGDLRFVAGDVLQVTRIVDELWYEGSCARDSYTKVGIFPQIYVKSLQNGGIINIYDLFPTLAKSQQRPR